MKEVAALADATQSSINRYENDQSAPPLPLLVWYADYFDVSLDYIFGRTGKRGASYTPINRSFLRKMSSFGSLLKCALTPNFP